MNKMYTAVNRKYVVAFLLSLVLSLAGLQQVKAQVATNSGSGLAATYPSLASAIAALNLATITGPVTITLTGNETAPNNTGYYITATGTAANTITIQGSSSTITAGTNTANGSMDAVFKIIGGDYITIQNFTIQENSANTVTATGATNTMTEAGILLIHASATDGAQNNTIQNNIITLSSVYANAVGILSTSSSTTSNASPGANTSTDATSTAGTNSNNKIYGNTISSVAYGVMFICPPVTATVFETGNDIGGSSLTTANTITYGNNTAGTGPWNRSSAASSGIQMRNGAGNSIRYNTITTISNLTVASLGINISSGTAPTGVTYTSTISNNSVTMTNTGTTAITAIDFGAGIATGTIAASNNTIIINQNATAATAAAIIGIKANYTSAGGTFNTNNITVNQAFSPSSSVSNTSAVTLLTLPGAVVNGTSTVNCLTNTLLINRTVTAATGITGTFTTGVVTGIQATTIDSVLNIGSVGNGNTITIKEAAVSGAGTATYSSAITFIDMATTTHRYANVVGNTINTTGSTIRSTGQMTGVYCNGTVTNLYNIKSNIANIDRLAASGAVYFTYNTGTPSNVADTVSSNNLTFTNISGTSTVTAISQLGGPSTSGIKSIFNNTISISGTNTGITKGISWGYSSGGKVVGNSVTISNAATTLIAIDGSGSSSGAGAFTTSAVNGVAYSLLGGISRNTISLTSTTTSPTSMIGVNASVNGPFNIFNNTFTTLNFSGIITGSPIVSGISVAAGTADSVYNNTITNITVGAATSTANPTVDGILIGAVTSSYVFKNKIYGIVSNCTGATGMVDGIRISGGTTNNIFNNLIGGLTAAASTNPDAIRGMNFTTTTATSTNNVYYNTINISGSGGTNFGSTGLFHTTSTTATTAVLNLRNNIIVNNSTANGTGKAVGFRRSSGIASTLANYASTSNNNNIYGTDYVYSDGTSTAATYAAYKGGVFTAGTISPRDQASASENVTFQSTTGSSANFLKYDVTVATQAESGAANIATYTDDNFGTIRQGNAGYAGTGGAPDMGAWELEGTGLDLISPTISYTALGSAVVGASQTLTATITDASGVPTTGTGLPVLYYRINGIGSWNAVTGSSIGSNQYTFVVGSSPATSTVGDIVTYYIVAQDNASTPNVGAYPSAGAASLVANPPIAGTPPTTPSSFTATAAINGDLHVCAGCTYTSLTNTGAAGAFAAINGATVNGNINILIDGDLSAETGAVALNAFASPYTVKIYPTGAVRTISGAVAAGTLIKLNGASRVTIDGSIGGTGTDKSLNITNTSTTGTAVIWIGSSAIAGATNNTIKNSTVYGNSTTPTVADIIVGSGTTAGNAAEVPNDNLTIQNNTLNTAQNAIYFSGNTTTYDNGLSINGNTIGSTVTASKLSFRGIYINAVQSFNIFNNSIQGVVTSTTSTAAPAGIQVGANINGGNIYKNTISDIKQNYTTYISYNGYGLYLGSTNATSNLNIYNNAIYDVNSSYYAADIYINSGGGYNIDYNSLSMTATGAYVYYVQNIYIASGVTNINLRNNVIVNSSTITYYNYGTVYCLAAKTIFNNIDYNDYFVNSTGNYNYLAYLGGSDLTLAALQASFGGNTHSINVNPSFITGTVLLNAGSPLLAAGTTLSGITTDRLGTTRSVTTPTIGAYETSYNAATAALTLTTPVNCASSVSHSVSITGTAGTASVVSGSLSYTVNGGSAYVVTLSGSNPFTGTIPSVSPSNALVAYSYSVTDANGISSVTYTGSYQDNPANGTSVTATASVNPVCSGTPSVLTANVISSLLATTYTAPPAVTSPTTDEDLGNVTIKTSDNVTTILNNTSTRNSLVGTIGTAAGTAGSYSDFTAFGPYILTSGSTYNFSLSSLQNTSPYSNMMAIYIDYNRNGVFTDPGETVYVASTTVSGAHTETGSFTIPATAFNGYTKMRVLCDEGTISGPTMTPGYGEYEEYLLYINSSNNGGGPTVTPTSISWTHTALTGTPITVSPVTTTTYQATASLSGCNVASNTINLATTALPAAPADAGTKSPQCGTYATFSATDGGNTGTITYNFYKKVGASYLKLTATPQSSGDYNWTTTDGLVNNGTTQNYLYATIVIGNCESPMTQIPDPSAGGVIVSAPPALSINATSLSTCPNREEHLTATGIGSFDSYTWSSPSSDLAATSGGTLGTAQSVTDVYYKRATATASEVITLTASNSNTSCSVTANTTMVVNAAPNIATATATATACSGTSISLNGQTNIIAAGNSTIGTGVTTTSSSSYAGTAFGNYWYQAWRQFVFTAAELSAAGLSAGNITSLTFNVSSLPSPTTVNNYAIRIGTTASTTLSTFTTTGLSLVYGPANITPTTGNNTITLATPYNWDGTSNILVDLREDGQSGSANSVNTYTATIGNKLVYAYSTSSNTGYYTSSPSATASTNRPNIVFAGQVSTKGPGTLTWSWSNGASTVLSAASGTVNAPTNTSGSNTSVTYTVTGTSASAPFCSASSAAPTTTVFPQPAAPTDNGTVTPQCGTPVFTVGTAASGHKYNWYNVSTGGTALVTSSSASYAYLANTVGLNHLWVSDSSATCESARTPIDVTVTTPPALTVSPTTKQNVCLGSAALISITPNGTDYASYVFKNGGTYTDLYLDAAGHTAYSGAGNAVYYIPSALATNKVITLDATNTGAGTCNNAATFTFDVLSVPDVSHATATATPTALCSGGTVNLTATALAPTSFYVGQASDAAGNLSSLSGYGMYFATTNAATINSVEIYPSTAGTLTITMKDGSGVTKDTRTFTIAAGDISTTVTKTLTFSPALVVPAGSTGWTLNYDIAINRGGVGTYTYPATSNGFSITGNTIDGNNPASGSRYYFYNWNVTSIGDITSNYTWTWATTAVLGTTVASGASTTATASNNGASPVSITYKAIASTGTCSASVNATAITINPLPTAPTNNGTLATQCGTPVYTVGTAASGHKYNWYTVATGGTPVVSSSSSSYTYTGYAVGMNHLWVSDSSATCESARTAIDVTVTAAPSLTVAPTTAQTVCLNSANLVSVTPNGSDYSSYVFNNGGTGVYTDLYTDNQGHTAYTGTSTNSVYYIPSTTGSHTITLSATNSGAGACNNSATYSFTVQALPVISTASATPSSVCSGSAVSLAATYGNSNNFNIGQATDLAANLSSLGTYGMYFSSTKAATINSVDIYPSTAGTLTVSLLDGSGATVTTRVFTIVAADISTTVKKTLVFSPAIPVPANASAYQLYYDLAINRGGVGTYTYPVTTDGFSITGNTLDGNNISSGTRYYFYNWNVTTGQDFTSSLNWVWYDGATALNASNTTGLASVSPTNNTSANVAKTYTIVATDKTAAHCTNSTNANTVTIVPQLTLGGISQSSVSCAGVSSNISLTGLVHSTSFTVTYHIGTGTDVTATVSSDAGGNATLPVVLALTDNTKTLTITNLQRTTTPNCSQVISANNTVTLSVNSSSVAPPTLVAATQNINANATATFTVSPTVTGTYSWYSLASGGTAIHTGSSYTTPNMCSGSTSYYVEVNNGTCVSPRTTATATVLGVITADPANGLICTAGAPVDLTANVANASSYTWTGAAGLSPVQTITVTPATTTAYTVSAVTSACGTLSATFNVGVITGGAAISPSATSVCINNAVQLNSNVNSTGFSVSAITSPVAATVPGSGVSTLVNNGTLTPALTGGSTDDGGWAGIPIGFSYNFFGNNYSTLSVSTNGVIGFGTRSSFTTSDLGKYNYDATGGPLANLVFPNPLNPANVIALMASDMTVSTTGSIKYWNDGIAPTRRFIIEYNQVPQLSYATQTSTVQAILYETTGVVEIYVKQALVATATAGSNTSTHAPTIGLQDATQTIGSTVPGRVKFVTDITNLEGWRFTPPSTSTFLWSTAGSAATGLTGGNTITNPVIPASAALAAGNYTYTVTVTNNLTGCATDADANFTINPLPAAPTAATTINYCQYATANILSATATGSNTLQWYTLATGGTGSASAPTPLTTTAGVTHYYVSQLNPTTGCESVRTDITVTVAAAPAVPTFTAAVPYCQYATSSALSATATGGNTLNWYTVSSGGSGSLSAPTPSTASSGTTNYYVTQSDGTCESRRTSGTITVTVTAAPAVPTVTSPVTYCQNVSAVALTATAAGTLNWYTVANGGSAIPTPTPVTTAAGTVDYYVSQTSASSGCESQRSLIAVVTNPTVTASVNASAPSTSVCGGGSITFTALPTNGGTSPTYQWYLNGTATVTTSTYALATPSANDDIYVVMTSNPAPGCLTGSPATSNHVILTSTSTTPSVSITASTNTICAGSSVTFNVSASANLGASPTYQWHSSVNGDITGATASSYTTTGLVNNEVITVIATSSLSPVCLTSTTASSNGQTVTVNPITSITTQPVSLTQCAGTTATFSVAAAGTGTYTYVWKKGASTITGATGSSYLINNIAAGDVATYTVVVSSGCGAAVTSNGATLALSTPTASGAVTISPSAAVCAGSSATFSAPSAAGTGTLTYIWKKNGTAISGANAATYVINSAVAGDAANYSVTVGGTCGTATSGSVGLTVNPVTTITTQPAASTTQCAGTTVNLSVAATGTGSFAYQWKKGGVNVTNGGNIAGATSATLSISSATTADAGNYTVVITATGGCGTNPVTSNTSVLNINPNTTITTQPSSVSNCSGSTVSFTVAATGSGTLTYQWKKGSTAISGAISATLTLTNISAANVGSYTCVVTGSCNSVTSNAATLAISAGAGNVWTGNVSTDFSTANNWCLGTVPSATAANVQATSTNRYPVLSSDASVTDLTLASGTTFGLGSNTLTITGNLTGVGTLVGSSTAGINMNSTAANTLTFRTTSSADSLLGTLTLSNTGKVSLGSGLGITTLLALNNAGAKLDINGNHLTLKSTSITNTAEVGVVTAGATIIDGTKASPFTATKVTVERFIPKGMRNYRDLAPSVANAGTVFANWQEAGVGSTSYNYGVYITGKTGTPGYAAYDPTTGFDLTTNGNTSPSAYSCTNGTWSAITTTSTNITNSVVKGTKGWNLDPFQGLRILVRGARNFNMGTNPSSMPTATTLRATGTLITGDVTFNAGSTVSGAYTSTYGLTPASAYTSGEGWSFVANPYACPISWSSIISNAASTGTNVGNFYCFLDPTYQNGGLQRYTTVQFTGTTIVTNRPSGVGSDAACLNIQPGQGFWVYHTAATPKLVIKESDKVVAGTHTTVFRTSKANMLNVSIWKDISGISTNIDETVATFDNNYTKEISTEDVKKLMNSGENISITENNNDLSIDGIATPTVNDVIALKLNNVVANTTYELKIDATQFATPGLQAYIKDAYLNTIVPAGNISFTPTTDATTYKERFSIVFKPAAVVPVTTVKGKITVYPNPVTERAFTVQMLNIAAGKYNVVLVNNLGQEVFNSAVTHKEGSSSETITMNRSLSGGMYTLVLRSVDGKTVYNTELLAK